MAKDRELSAAAESVQRHPARKFRDGRLGSPADELLAVEEPLEIRLGGQRFTLTMRTPGNDEELVTGFLFAEGFIESHADIGEIRRVRGDRGVPEPNALDVILNVPASNLRERLRRNFIISSSCGVCGKTSIESIQRRVAPIESNLTVRPSALLALAPMMRPAQQIFSSTGGLHAAAIFMPDDGGEPVGSFELAILREDVGRHNAVDKAVGWAVTNGMLPLSRALMMVSGRLSFEIVQKAAAAGVPVLAAVSAPSSLAVELAEEIGMTLVGFLRAGSFNVYCRSQRIAERGT
jgi:FdhD protein